MFPKAFGAADVIKQESLFWKKKRTGKSERSKGKPVAQTQGVKPFTQERTQAFLSQLTGNKELPKLYNCISRYFSFGARCVVVQLCSFWMGHLWTSPSNNIKLLLFGYFKPSPYEGSDVTFKRLGLARWKIWKGNHKMQQHLALLAMSEIIEIILTVTAFVTVPRSITSELAARQEHSPC